MNQESSECLAAVSFVQYFGTNFDSCGVIFHICRLKDAINQACLTTQGSRKIMVLYFHNAESKFSQTFCKSLTTAKIRDMISERFFLLGWDVGNDEYHPALKTALSASAELSCLLNLVETKSAAALLIVPVNESIMLFSCLRGNVSHKELLSVLKEAEIFFINENNAERDLQDIIDRESSTLMGSENYQKLMLDMLGDRDYDSFDYDEHDLLKEKIGYAVYGPPQEQDGYNEKQKAKIDSLYEVILQESNAVSKWRDRVIISFITNCIEPLPKKKLKRAKKDKSYNPLTDLVPLPIFVLRKCKHCENPCRVFIDDTGRVYGSWMEYIQRNKLPDCQMILPKDGRYQANENGKVLLERFLSPSCGIDVKILQGADVASTAVGLASGGVILAAAIPAITIAPVALIAAGAAGLGAGLYGLGRSAYVLYDRKRHKETLSLANSEARGAYLNIVAGSLGFVGVGANMAVTQFAARGFNIGQGATAAVSLISITNVGVSGISVVNSGYDVIYQWIKENQKPSLLAMVQLSSSILFFGHAVYNFKMAGTIVEETQASVLQEYQDSLRSNRHRKMFTKLQKETIRTNNGNVVRGQAEVIKAIRNIANKDEVFAVLTRSNKEMNKNGIKFSAVNGEIQLNGVSIDMRKFMTMDSIERTSFLSQLSVNTEPTPREVDVMTTHIANKFDLASVDVKVLAFNLVKILGNASDSVKDKIINAVATLVSYLIESTHCMSVLNEMFPNFSKYFRLFQMVEGFFQKAVDLLEDRYQAWRETQDPTTEEPIFYRLALDAAKRALELFDYVSRIYFVGSNLTEAGLKELLKYFYDWLAVEFFKYRENSERRERRSAHSAQPSTLVKCNICEGSYYQQRA